MGHLEFTPAKKSQYRAWELLRAAELLGIVSKELSPSLLTPHV